MEQVFFRIHVRVAKIVGSFASSSIRSVFEILAFINGILVCGLLFWLHVNYIPAHDGDHTTRNSCIETYLNSDVASTIENCEGPGCSGNVNMWKIHLSTQVYSDLAKSTIELPGNEYQCSPVVVEDLFREYLYSQMGLFYDDSASHLFSGKTSTQEISSSGLSATNSTNKYIVDVQCLGGDSLAYKRKLLQSQLATISRSFRPDESLGTDSTLLQLFGQQYVFLYSRHKALLMMRPEIRGRFGVTLKNVQIVQSDKACMGDNGYLISLLQKYIGFDAFMRNWAMEAWSSDGYLYSVMSKDLSNLNAYKDIRSRVYPSVHFGGVALTLFLYFVASSLTSFTLKSTQERMLKFAYLLQHHVRNRIPYFQLVSTHIVQSFMFVPILVGMQFFIVEFFGDHLLSFFAVTAVWLVEVYSALWYVDLCGFVIVLACSHVLSFCTHQLCSMRTKVTRVTFPKLFVAYFLLFTIYCDNYPYGFPYVALVAVYCFVVHAMMFFYNHFEMPALENGEINAMVPRQWINVEVYENVPDPSVSGAHDSQGSVDTIWHTGGIRRRRDSDTREPIHNTTVYEEGVSISTFVLGSSTGSASRVLLQPPSGISLSVGGTGRSSGYVQNLALSRLIQYEQMASQLGEAVMESSHTNTHYKGRFHDDSARERQRSGSTATPVQSVTWFQDIMSAFGVGRDTRPNSGRSRADSLPESIASSTPASSTSSTSSMHSSPGGKKDKPARPDTGISPYDMTGYKPEVEEGAKRRKSISTDRPIPPRRKTAAEAKARAADPVDDFGHKKAAATYNAFGSLEED
jgi:hypothetical protein